MAPEEEKQSITSCAVGHVGNTRYPKSQESFRSGRSANMIDKEGHYVQTVPVRRALEDAVRDFVLHSRAVGSGQPRGYDDPNRTGNHLQRTSTNTDYSHFRQFVMKEARKPLYQEMYRAVHGRRIKWLHDVEEATPADFKAVYDASQLGDVNNGVDRTPQLVEHDQRCRTPCKCGFPADECQCHDARRCRQQALKKWPEKQPPLLTGMDEEWEEITQQLKQETNPSVLQEYVDAPSPAVAASTTLTNQTIHAMFQQPYQQVQDELARQPNLSTQLLNEIEPTTVVMTMNETAEFEAELQRMDAIGTSLGIEDEVNYPGLIARIANDGQSIMMYLEPRANDWLNTPVEEGIPPESTTVSPTTPGSPTTPVSPPTPVLPTTTESSFPIATTAIQEAISKDYEGTSKKYGNDPTSYMKKLVEEAGIARATFVHEPSKWDLENAMKIELLPTGTRKPRWFSQIDTHRHSKASSETQGPGKELPHCHGHCQGISPSMRGTRITRSHCILRTRPRRFQMASGTYGTSHLTRRIRRVVHQENETLWSPVPTWRPRSQPSIGHSRT